MNAGSIIKLELYNVSMDCDIMVLILLLSTMKYDLEISTHISTLSVNKFPQNIKLLRPLCCAAWLSMTFYPSQASRQVLE